MRLKGSFSALLALLTIFLLAVAAVALQAAGNPQVPRGGSASFPSTGSEGALNSEAWDVVNSAGTVVAKASLPQGWTVALSGTTFTVGAPAAALIAPNYKVRYGSGDVIFNPARAQKKNAKAAAPPASPWGAPAKAGLKAARGGIIVNPQPVGGSSALFDVVAPPAPPAAPTNLTATAVSSNTINLAWTDNSANEAGFRIERKTGATGVWAQIAVANVNATAYADNTGLAPSTLYVYRVRATNANGDSAYSNEASATTFAPTPPAAPTALTATALSGTSVRLAWTDNANNEDGFKIYRINGTGWPIEGGAPLVANLGPNATSFVDTSVSPLTTYTYLVVAYNVAGSGSSNFATVTTPAGPPPGSQGADFWFALPSSGTFMFQPTYYLSISAVGPTTGYITIPGTSYTEAFRVTSGSSVVFELPSGTELTTADGIEAKAVHVECPSPISVQILNYGSASSEGFTPIATSALGKRYVLATYRSGTLHGDPEVNALFAVVASQDATTVTISPSATIGTHVAKVPYTITLNRGDAYQLKGLQQDSDLTGTIVTADKPVQVLSGNQGALVPLGVSSLNPLTEALPPVDRWGTSFVAVPYAGRAGDRLRVIAAYNDTKVYVDGAQVDLLAQGGFHERELTATAAVSADKPILLEQFSKGSAADGVSLADPFMTTVPAITQFVPSAAFNVPDATRMSSNSVNVVVPAAAVGDLRLDGIAVPAASFTAVGTTGYRYARLSVAAGAHVLSTPTTGLGFGAWLYGFSSTSAMGYDGYGDPVALGLPLSAFTPIAPSAPTALSATAVSAGAINLAWTDNAANEVGFRIERKTAAADWAPLATVGPNVRTYADTGLSKATAYTYRVRAYADLDSDWSNEASATTFDTPPSAPTNPYAVALSATAIDLTWIDASNNETGFVVERKQGTGSYGPPIPVAANTPVFHDTGLIKKTAYTYRVTAKNAYGSSAPSAEVTATTKDTPPSAPSGLTAASPAYNQVVLNWADNADNETGFKVERSPNGTSWTQIYSYDAVNITTFVDNTVQGATPYWYRVRVYNDGGDSPYSNVATVTTQNPPPPTAPTGLTATAVFEDQVDLKWTDNATTETGFRIERKTGTGQFGFLANANPNSVAFSDITASPSTTYTYRVRAYNLGGDSAWSNEASATTPAPQPTSSATYLSDVKADRDFLIGSGTVSVTVSFSRRLAASTTVAIKADSSVSCPPSIVVPANSRSYSFTASISPRASTFRIEPSVIRATSADWAQVCYVTCLPSAADLGLSSVEVVPGSQAALVRWRDLNEKAFGTTLAGFDVYRQIGTTTTKVNPRPITEGSFLDTGLTSNTSMTYQVRLVDRAGTVVATSAWTSTTTGSGASLAWVGSPTVATNRCSVVAQRQISGAGTIFIDGMPVGRASNQKAGSVSSPTQLRGSVGTVSFGTGSHKVAVAQWRNGVLYSTPAATVALQTSGSLVVCEDFADPDAGDAVAMQCNLGQAQSWTVSVCADNGSVIRSWTGFSAVAKVAWDVKTQPGAPIGNGHYRWEFPFAPPGGSSNYYGITVQRGQPELLALVQIIAEDRPEDDLAYAIHVRESIQAIEASHPGTYGLMLCAPDDLTFSERLRLKIRYWMQYTVRDFYYWGHGAQDNFTFGGLMFQPDVTGSPRTGPTDYNDPAGVLSVPLLFQYGRMPFNSVFLDMCNGGGTGEITPGSPTFVWPQAFQINDPQEQCFVGYAGYSGGMSNFGYNYADKTIWFDFCKRYWSNIAGGYTISQALGLALLHANGPNGNIMPGDTGRLQIYGDEWVPES